jgi:hypothetical protein
MARSHEEPKLRLSGIVCRAATARYRPSVRWHRSLGIRRLTSTSAMVRAVALAVLCGACFDLPIGKGAVSVRGRVAGRDVDGVFGQLVCEHGGWINVYDGRGNVLVFAPRGWKPIIGVASMDASLGRGDHLQRQSNAGWINADFTQGFSMFALSGRTIVTAVSDTEVSGRLEWTMGLPGDSGRVSVAGAFRVRRGCP